MLQPFIGLNVCLGYGDALNNDGVQIITLAIDCKKVGCSPRASPRIVPKASAKGRRKWLQGGSLRGVNLPIFCSLTASTLLWNRRTMEHLPSPLHSLHADKTKVPYVCKKPYDGGSFLTYPVREGKAYVLPAASSSPGQLPFWQHEKLHPTPKEELESFFQTWLFFGLIHEVLADLCSPQDFIRASQEATDKVMSTSNLISITETWISKVINGDIVTTYDHLAECLRVTFAALRAVNPEFDQRIKLSIASTGEVLEYAVNKAFHIENMARDNKCPASWPALIDKAAWTESMQAAGWCPSQIFILCQGAISIQSLYYFTALRQPDSPSRHQSCSERKCTAHQNNLEKYTTQHCTSDCECEELSVNIGAVEDILLKGEIPLLRVIPGQSLADLNLEIISSQPDSQYVALSHVWADGLGNPYANALPRCQLLRLQGLLQCSNMPWDSGDNDQELLLWCDTLCCPVRHSEAKNRALLQMKRTYHDATIVLVLDASLQLCDSSPSNPEEMCARISSSGWTRRLWTLQEGTLITPSILPTRLPLTKH